LLPEAVRRLNGGSGFGLAHQGISGLENLDKVIHVDQSPIGRSPRSNPATYTGLFAELRTLFANLSESKVRGYTPARFSFNVKGGRCESCQGDGVRRIEMHFLADVFVTCRACNGRRYNRETLAVTYRGKSIADVLAMSVSDACDFFANYPALRQKLETLRDVGLGYVTLGQSARRSPAARPSGSSSPRSWPEVDRHDPLHPRRADHRPALRRHRKLL
jgi:excinuclease ABC subunit A